MEFMYIMYKSIRTHHLFADLSDEEIDALHSVSSFRQYSKKETIFLQGDVITHFYIVNEGSVQLFHVTPNGHELTSYIVNEGEAILDPACITPEANHSINARAVNTTKLLQIPIVQMRHSIKKYENLAAKMLEILALRLEKIQVEAEHQATMSASQITACFLQHICAYRNMNPYSFKLPYTKSLIATRLNMELESLSRAMTRLKKHGIVVRGKEISFTNLDAAQEHCCSECSIVGKCLVQESMRDLEKTYSIKKSALSFF